MTRLQISPCNKPLACKYSITLENVLRSVPAPWILMTLTTISMSGSRIFFISYSIAGLHHQLYVQTDMITQYIPYPHKYDGIDAEHLISRFLFIPIQYQPNEISRYISTYFN